MGRQLGRRIFFAVVDDDGSRRSTVWQFKVRGSEVYGGQLDMHQFKLSLHSGGLCMWAFDTPYWHAVAKHDRPHRKSRVIQKWTRPPTAETGSVHAFSVGFPGSALGSPRAIEGVPEDRLFRLSPPEKGRVAEIQVRFSRDLPEIVREKLPSNYRFVAAPLDCGEFVYFMPLDEQFDDQMIKTFLAQPKTVEWASEQMRQTPVLEGASASWYLPALNGTCGRVLEIGGLNVAASSPTAGGAATGTA